MNPTEPMHAVFDGRVHRPWRRAERYLRGLGLPAPVRRELLDAVRTRAREDVTEAAVMQLLFEVMDQLEEDTGGIPRVALWSRMVAGRSPEALRACAHPVVTRSSMAPRPWYATPRRWLYGILQGLQRRST